MYIVTIATRRATFRSISSTSNAHHASPITRIYRASILTAETTTANCHRLPPPQDPLKTPRLAYKKKPRETISPYLLLSQPPPLSEKRRLNHLLQSTERRRSIYNLPKNILFLFMLTPSHIRAMSSSFTIKALSASTCSHIDLRSQQVLSCIPTDTREGVVTLHTARAGEVAGRPGRHCETATTYLDIIGKIQDSHQNATKDPPFPV